MNGQGSDVAAISAEDTRSSAAGTHTPEGCPIVSVAHDADEQARNLVGWRQSYDQLAAGRFVGTLTELPLDGIKVFRETTSHLLCQTCEVRGDAYWFGLPVADDGGARIDARPIPSHALAFRPGNVEFELLTPARFAIYGVVVRGSVLRRYADEVERTGFDGQMAGQSVISASAGRLAPLRALLAQRLDGADARAGGLRAPLSRFECEELEAGLLAALFDAWTAPSDESLPDLSSRRRWIVAQARDYVLAHRSRPVGVPELCGQLHISRRTLQYCFQDVLGMAPAAYLRAVRLNGARRDLGTRAAASVQDAAAAWGFGHLSQFAADYRRMFGMRPSEALAAAG